ncbi:MAG TPA: hypothetical protein VE868_12620 [Balneolaceae bacterium]|nr:hypothetical protein [Balneolaceae bacterium]
MDQEKVQQRIAELMDDATECGRQLIKNEEFGRQFEEFKKQTEDSIREHPLKSVAIGLIGGYLVAKIFS